MNLQQVKGVIFDMDGLLVDSEPYWKIAEKEVFGKLGLNLSDELLRQVMGFRLNEVVLHWYNYKPWPNPDFTATEQDVLNTVTNLILNNATAMPGVYELLHFLQLKNLPMAVASSSAKPLIDVVLNKLNITHYFKQVHSAQFEDYGKPHPAIFLKVARQFGFEPTTCLVFEDSINGVIAAKAARMQCIAIPEPEKLNDPRFSIADKIYPSLTHALQDL